MSSSVCGKISSSEKECWISDSSSKEFTTVMVKNIPTRFTPNSLIDAIAERGYIIGCFDFLYMPMDFKTKKNCGYCFINFLSHALAAQFKQHMEGAQLRAATSEKCLHIIPSRRQGLKDNMNIFASSELLTMQEPPVKHGSSGSLMPAIFRPLVLLKGELIPLTEKIFNEFITNEIVELERRTTDDTMSPCEMPPLIAALFSPHNVSLDDLTTTVTALASPEMRLDELNLYMDHCIGACDNK